MRTFIAIKIAPENKLTELVNRLKNGLEGESIKWANVSNFHLTIKFLGETSGEQLAQIKRVLKNLTRNFKPFRFGLKGLGYFKSGNQPRVLFLKIDNVQVLKQLIMNLENEIVKLGFQAEGRELKPHLTLARIKFIKNKNSFYSLVKGFAETKIQDTEVSEIIFYESILGSGDPVYKPIRIFKLN